MKTSIPKRYHRETTQSEDLDGSEARFDSFQAGAQHLKQVRAVAWVSLVVAGLIQAWNTRHFIFSDGVSYLEIASYYAAGDWHSALNSYWSPLYSWILALVIALFRPNPYWYPALLHAINYLTFLTSLLAFETFLSDLIRLRERRVGPGGLSESALYFEAMLFFLSPDYS